MVPVVAAEGAGDINEGARTREIRSLLGLFEEDPQRFNGSLFINALQRVSLQLRALQFNQAIAVDLAAGDAHRIVPNDGGDTFEVLPMVGIEPSPELDNNRNRNRFINHNLADVGRFEHVAADHLFDEMMDDLDDDQDDPYGAANVGPDLGAHGDGGLVEGEGPGEIDDNNNGQGEQ